MIPVWVRLPKKARKHTEANWPGKSERQIGAQNDDHGTKRRLVGTDGPRPRQDMVDGPGAGRHDR